MSVTDGRHPLTERQITRRARAAAKPERVRYHATAGGALLSTEDHHRVLAHRAARRRHHKIVRVSRVANR